MVPRHQEVEDDPEASQVAQGVAHIVGVHPLLAMEVEVEVRASACYKF